MHKYKVLSKKGEGTFSEVLKAQSIKNQQLVAIKRMKNHFESIEQVKNLREIQALRRLSPHENIIRLIEVLYDRPTGRLALVFELMAQNIYELIRGRRHYLAEAVVKKYMYQLCRSMDHMHRNGIFHRDIKPENILVAEDTLKLADFGSCRGIYSKQPYTEYISTRWYRAPESLLTDGYYNYKMDMWGVGCVFFEVLSLFPLFPGTNEIDQIQKIHNVLGTPSAEVLSKFKKRSPHMDFNFPKKEGTGIAKLVPHVSAECVDLISKLLIYNPEERISARQALRHPYFKDLRDAEKRAAATSHVPGAIGKPGAAGSNKAKSVAGSSTAGSSNNNNSNNNNSGNNNSNSGNINANKRGPAGMRRRKDNSSSNLHNSQGGASSKDDHLPAIGGGTMSSMHSTSSSSFNNSSKLPHLSPHQNSNNNNSNNNSNSSSSNNNNNNNNNGGNSNSNSGNSSGSALNVTGSSSHHHHHMHHGHHSHHHNGSGANGSSGGGGLSVHGRGKPGNQGMKLQTLDHQPVAAAAPMGKGKAARKAGKAGKQYGGGYGKAAVRLQPL